MNTFVVLSRRHLLLGCAAMMLAPRIARAGLKQLEDFSISVPSNWATQTGENRFEAHSANEVIYLRAQVLDLKPKETLLTARLKDVIDDELDDYDITSDTLQTMGPEPVRVVEGRGKDEDDDVLFRVIAIAGARPNTVILAMIYAEKGAFLREANATVISKVLGSLERAPQVSGGQSPSK